MYFIRISHNRPINIFNDALDYNVTFACCILVFLSTRLSVTLNGNKNYSSTQLVRVPYVKDICMEEDKISVILCRVFQFLNVGNKQKGSLSGSIFIREHARKG